MSAPISVRKGLHCRCRAWARRPAVLALLLCGSLSLAAATSHADDAVAGSDAGNASPTLDLWLQSAPLPLVIRQIAELDGRSVELQGVPDSQVSARFTGSVEDALRALAEQYPVLFDQKGDTLLVSHGDQASSISVAVVSDDLGSDFRQSLFEHMAPGNDVEIRADAIRVSGHPAFVRRMTGLITGQIARSGARQVGGDVIVDAPENASATASATASANDPAESVLAPQDEELAVVDAGSEEMLADIVDENRPETDQAELSRPIRWVTDIPGYHTF